MEHETLATEMLREIKASSQRWFRIALIELLIILIMSLAFIWYISLPVDEYGYTIEQEAQDRSFNIVGGDYNGSAAESDILP